MTNAPPSTSWLPAEILAGDLFLFAFQASKQGNIQKIWKYKQWRKNKTLAKQQFRRIYIRYITAAKGAIVVELTEYGANVRKYENRQTDTFHFQVHLSRSRSDKT